MSSGSDNPLAGLPVVEAARRIRSGKVSPVELVRACLDRIRALDGTLRAWVHVDEAGALAVAGQREREARRKRFVGPLHGIPVGVKDIIDVADMPTKAGAAAFAHRLPGNDATAVARLRAAGAIVLGKTATTEFAYRDPAPTRNPWNPEHTPGGSSAGSAAAVAARMIPLALGSQTVGSVLRPAAYCGVVGFKATHGRVPADGVVPLAWSLDHVGLFARGVTDVAVGLGVVIGRAVRVPAVRAPRIALAPELLKRADAEVATRISAAADRLARAGARIREVKLPGSFADLHAAGLTILEVEAAAYHEPAFREHARDYGTEIRKCVETGSRTSATAYVTANRRRLAFRADALELLAAYDALLSPTAPAPAPRGLGSTGDASLCAPWSYAGVPAITLPTGLAASGLPHAVQLVAGADREAPLLGVAAWCERRLGFGDRSP